MNDNSRPYEPPVYWGIHAGEFYIRQGDVTVLAVPRDHARDVMLEMLHMLKGDVSDADAFPDVPITITRDMAARMLVDLATLLRG